MRGIVDVVVRVGVLLRYVRRGLCLPMCTFGWSGLFSGRLLVRQRPLRNFLELRGEVSELYIEIRVGV